MILPHFPKNRKEKRGIITSLVTGFIRLAYKGISSNLHDNRLTALKRAFIVMEKSKKIRKKQGFSFRRFNGNVWHL